MTVYGPFSIREQIEPDHAIPSALLSLARLPIREVWTTNYDRLIERAFGVLPLEHYGMAEAVANVSMCPSRRLHVDEDFAATELRNEVLDGGIEVPLGDPLGRLAERPDGPREPRGERAAHRERDRQG